MKDTNKSGVSIVGVLTIVFVVLKLTKLISWSWLWVLSPLWISIAIALAYLFILALILIADNLHKRNQLKTLLIFVGLFAILASFNSCESCSRFKKSWKSEYHGGLERTATLYDYNGDTLGYWEGKFDIRDSGSDNQIFFDLNDKRVWIQGGIFVTEEK